MDNKLSKALEINLTPEAKQNSVEREDYLPKALELIKKHEGFREYPYIDPNNNETTGWGFNMNAPDTKTVVDGFGYTPDKPMSKEMADQILSTIYANKERRLKSEFSDTFDSMPTGQKVALGSLYYNSPALIGPKIKEYASKGDSLALAKEILINSNKNKELGVAKRRINEAEQVADLSDVYKIMSPEERQQLRDIILNSNNENVKNEILQQYGQALGLTPAPIKFNKLNLSN